LIQGNIILLLTVFNIISIRTKSMQVAAVAIMVVQQQKNDTVVAVAVQFCRILMIRGQKHGAMGKVRIVGGI
jgi:hypothetical protein